MNTVLEEYAYSVGAVTLIFFYIEFLQKDNPLTKEDWETVSLVVSMFVYAFIISMKHAT